MRLAMAAKGRHNGSRCEQFGLLEITCWCERLVILIPRREVLAGRTQSCGELWCYPGCDRVRTAPIGRGEGRWKVELDRREAWLARLGKAAA